jgi:hypothetical protein
MQVAPVYMGNVTCSSNLWSQRATRPHHTHHSLVCLRPDVCLTLVTLTGQQVRLVTDYFAVVA